MKGSRDIEEGEGYSRVTGWPVRSSIRRMGTGGGGRSVCMELRAGL